MNAIVDIEELSSEAVWKRATEKLDRATVEHIAAIDAFGDVQGPYFAAKREKPDLPQPAEYAGAEARQEQACDAFHDALTELIGTPAPDHVSVLRKIDLAREHSLPIDKLDAVWADLEDPQETYEHGLTYGHEQFAQAWLNLWTASGGSVTMDHTDLNKAWFGVPMFDLSPGQDEYDKWEAGAKEQAWFQALSGKDQEHHLGRHRSFLSDRYDGGMRQLHALVQGFPEGLQAIKRFVTVVPQAGMPKFAAGEAA